MFFNTFKTLDYNDSRTWNITNELIAHSSVFCLRTSLHLIQKGIEYSNQQLYCCKSLKNVNLKKNPLSWSKFFLFSPFHLTQVVAFLSPSPNANLQCQRAWATTFNRPEGKKLHAIIVLRRRTCPAARVLFNVCRRSIFLPSDNNIFSRWRKINRIIKTNVDMNGGQWKKFKRNNWHGFLTNWPLNLPLCFSNFLRELWNVV